MEQIQRMLSREETDGVLSGYSDLDGLTNGFKPGEMIVLAARPSVGKTSLAMNIVENIAFSHKNKNNPKNTLVFSLEMSAPSLAMRLICGKAKVNMNDLRKGFVPKSKAESLNKTCREFQQAALWVDDVSGLTINQIRAKARRLKMRRNLGLIVVDYLQLISADGRIQSRENQISDISPLTSLSALQKLHLAINQIQDISPLSGLTDLSTLYLGQNQIRSLEPLTGLKGLHVLSGGLDNDESPLERQQWFLRGNPFELDSCQKEDLPSALVLFCAENPSE